MSLAYDGTSFTVPLLILTILLLGLLGLYAHLREREAEIELVAYGWPASGETHPWPAVEPIPRMGIDFPYDWHLEEAMDRAQWKHDHFALIYGASPRAIAEQIRESGRKAGQDHHTDV